MCLPPPHFLHVTASGAKGSARCNWPPLYTRVPQAALNPQQHENPVVRLLRIVYLLACAATVGTFVLFWIDDDSMSRSFTMETHALSAEGGCAAAAYVRA